jgi:two-component system sensor histidine kinase KdpD
MGLAIICLITLFYRRALPVNATTAGFTFLMAILIASTVWGFRVATAMSVTATLAFDYFFLPPVGTLNIADPQDWVALFSFLVTAVLGSSLSAHAHRRAVEANRRSQELEWLCALSQRLLDEGNLAEIFRAIPQDLLGSFGAESAALFLSKKQEIYRAGIDIPQLNDGHLRIAAKGEKVEVEGDSKVWFVPLLSGTKVIGSVGISGPAVSRETMRALGCLVAATVERAVAIEHAGKMEAARESEHLRSVVMDAITHDFRTPLTCIKASVTGLLSDVEFDREQKKDLLSMIDEECDRLDHLVGKTARMAHLEPGEIKLVAAPHAVGELISTALAECKSTLRARPIHLEVRDKESRVLVDMSLARTVLGHLISNADLYSSPGKPITISTEEKDGLLFLSVKDQGPGIEETEAELIFEKFYRGKDQRSRVDGTGMGLPIARAIVEAHGGTIGVVSQPGQGSVFTFSLPIV